MTKADESDLDILPCGVVEIDKHRKVIRSNRYALELLNCQSVSDIVGVNIEELLTSATRIFLDSYVYPMLLIEGKVEEIQLSLKTVESKKVPIVANIRMNPDKTTCWVFMSCANRDQLYTELLVARDTLQTQTRALEQLNAESQERQSGLQAFCHSLSHDFISPIRRIRQLIELAMEDLKEAEKAPDVLTILEIAGGSANVLLQLVNGLVDYLVADVAVPMDEVIDLDEIVSTVLAMREWRGSMALKVHWLSQPRFLGSSTQMQVIFKNLIENAIKFNDNDPEITIRHEEDSSSDRLIISIKDNGIGMSKSHLDAIFNPFTRLNTAAEYKGSGLGLSIVRKMVLNHDGDIHVESTPGCGSTFYVSLPLRSSLN